MALSMLDNGHYQAWAFAHWENDKNDCAIDGGYMDIKLNMYQRGSVGQRSGVVFEPQIWHRVQFLQKNLIRFFSTKYLVKELYVEVASTTDHMVAFEFNFNNRPIRVTPVDLTQ